MSLAISGGLLTILLTRLDLDAIRQSFADIHVSVMCLGLIMFGLFLLLGSLRWRIALRASSLDVPFSVLLRASVVGHVFNMVFFGPVGGDLAKSTAYARWHDYELPDVLATAVVDRSFSAIGALTLAALTLVAFFASPGSPSLALDSTGNEQPWLLPTGLLVALVLTLVGIRLRRRPFLSRLFGAFAEIARQLHRAPIKVVAGCLLGLGGQILVSYILLVCLLAITYPQTACAELVWAYPLIAAIAGLPFSIAGAGLREGVALVLLGGCGVAPEQVVAAGILVLAIYGLWAIVGTVVFTWEEYRHKRAG